MKDPRFAVRALHNPLEIWGGVECTVNRVGDRYFDQLERSGHAQRMDDLRLFAALGVRTLRFPVLWERVAPDGLHAADWNWVDARLNLMAELGITPIAGFLHHGSGPAGTDLLDPAFPEKLADFARAFAERHPHVTHFTPVNEPLTTARFSGLYGHWYPHRADASSFARALLNQVRGVVLAMRAIREITPHARLVQTEDLGKVFSTPRIAYQAAFENDRRWLTFDLLTGRTLSHRINGYLREAGVAQRDIDWFRENVCPPDIAGVNHYVTSDRFLDDRLEHYPPHMHGGNGRHAYVDVEAVRVRAEGGAGLRVLLREAWERYRLPLAVTEVHLAGWREEQLRWLADAWESAMEVRNDGVDVRAITSWALLGAYDWASLLTRSDDCYESGAFDVRSGAPRATAVAEMVRGLAGGDAPSHPVLCSDGWWKRRERLLYPSFRCGDFPSHGVIRARHAERRPILITGATGTLGRAFARICRDRAIEHRLLSRSAMDITDPRSIAEALDRHRAWAVVNCAGFVRVDEAEWNQVRCWRENVDGPVALAAACAVRGIAFVTFSSDLVFDGSAGRPHVESDDTSPINEYGRSKAAAESGVLAAMPAALVIRTSAFFGPWDEYNVVTRALRALSDGDQFAAAGDALISPTYVPDLAHGTLDLLIDRASGIWHLANSGAITWTELIRQAAELTQIDASALDERSTIDFGFAAPRPLYTVLGTERGQLLPPLEDALRRFASEWTAPAAEVVSA